MITLFKVELPMEIIYGIGSAIFWGAIMCVSLPKSCKADFSWSTHPRPKKYEEETEEEIQSESDTENSFDYSENSCVNTDYGSKDKFGDTCNFYDNAMDKCGFFDESDFVANELCCACGGGYWFE